MPKFFTDGTALYYVVPNNEIQCGQPPIGNTIIKVENINFILTVSHECKYNRLRSDIKCRHVLEAEIYYKQWRWWEIFEQVKYVRGNIILSPDWEHIDILDSVDMEKILFSKDGE